MLTRLNRMITKEKMLRSFIKLSQLISKEKYEYQSGEFVCGYWYFKECTASFFHKLVLETQGLMCCFTKQL